MKFFGILFFIVLSTSSFAQNEAFNPITALSVFEQLDAKIKEGNVSQGDVSAAAKLLPELVKVYEAGDLTRNQLNRATNTLSHAISSMRTQTKTSDPDVKSAESTKRQFTNTIEGRLVSIADGDTITVLVDDSKPIKIRLEGIDAPEKGQAYGSQSKYALSTFLSKSPKVTVKITGNDKYGRSLGWVYVNNECANDYMIRNGWAWHYKKYNSEPELSNFEDLAKKEKLGLWQDLNPMAPWDFRHGAEEARLAALRQQRQVAQSTTNNVYRTTEKQPQDTLNQSSGSNYWLNGSKRHNSGCRWYGATKKGRFCGANEGVAAGCCGG